MASNYEISALVVVIVENDKFEHDFCTNFWFFMAQKGRCARLPQARPMLTMANWDLTGLSGLTGANPG